MGRNSGHPPAHEPHPGGPSPQDQGGWSGTWPTATRLQPLQQQQQQPGAVCWGEGEGRGRGLCGVVCTVVWALWARDWACTWAWRGGPLALSPSLQVRIAHRRRSSTQIRLTPRGPAAAAAAAARLLLCLPACLPPPLPPCATSSCGAQASVLCAVRCVVCFAPRARVLAPLQLLSSGPSASTPVYYRCPCQRIHWLARRA